jgi:hypothetical protein
MALFNNAPKNFAPYGPSTGLSAGGVGRPRVTPMKVPRNPQSPAPKISGRAGSMPKAPPPTDMQVATQQVAASFDPVLAQIRQAYQQMVQGAGQAYNAGAKQLADLYGSVGPQTQSAYDRASQGLAAISGMLAGVQQGQGAAQQADLTRQLQGIDAGTAGRVSGQFGQNLQGEALANATRGSNNLAALLAEGAHAGQYTAQLPAIGGTIGFRGLQQALGTLNQNQQNELAKLAAQEPSAVQTALAGIQSNRYKQQQLGFENSLKQETFGLNAQKAQTAAQQGQERIAQQRQAEQDRVAIAQTNAALRQEGISAANQRSQNSLNARVKQGYQPSASLSRAYGYIVDAHGNAILDANGKHIPVAKTSKKSAAGVPPWGK